MGATRDNTVSIIRALLIKAVGMLAICLRASQNSYGSGKTRRELHERHHRLVIKPLPSRPSVSGGLLRDDFVVDHEQRLVTCPAGHRAKLSKAGVARFAPHLTCPLRADEGAEPLL